MHFFYPRRGDVDCFARSFAELAREGLGPGRGRAELDRVEPIVRNPPLALGFDPAPARGVRVVFRTPTELKSSGVASTPEFATLFARIRDRISTLRALYGPGSLPIDHRELGERAARISMTRSEFRPVRAERRSSRTRESHSIGGFVGWAEYEGELGEFVPYLEAAHWTGVGRHTVWGNGLIDVERLYIVKPA